MHMYGDADKIVQCILKGCHIISVMNMWEWWIKKQSNWLARAEEIALKKHENFRYRQWTAKQDS